MSVRLSNVTMTRNYRNQLNTAQSRVYDANMKASTLQRFDSMDEDVAGGLRYFQVRRQLQRTETHLSNVKDVQTFYNSVEDHVTNLVDLARDTYKLTIAAPTGTNGADERKAISAQVKRYQEEVLTTLNSQFSDRHVFGGTNVKKAPYSVDAEGFLNYTYKDESGLYKTIAVKDINADHPDYMLIMDDPSFVDIGSGLELQAGEMIPSTVFDRTINGLQIIGVGEDNMYDRMTMVLKELESDQPNFDIIEEMNSSYKDAALFQTKLGADTKYLDFTVSRLNNDNLNLETRKKSIVGIDAEEAALDLKMRQYTYEAALAVGTHILQPSLFSFLR